MVDMVRAFSSGQLTASAAGAIRVDSAWGALHRRRMSRTFRYPRATLAATILGSSLAFIDSSVVNVALPALAHEFHASPANLTWTINAYLLPLSALILLGGSLGDHFGRRRLFLTGLCTFTIATIICAAAPSLAWLLAGRGLQGLGAALLMPNSLAILGGSFAGEARGRAIGTWAAVGALAGALGPIIGGWLIDTISWRAIFLLNVPIAAAAGLLTWKYVGESNDSQGAAPLDSVGAGLATLALGLLTYALAQASDPHDASAWSRAATLTGVAFLAVFFWHEHRRGELAIVPLTMFSSSMFVGLSLLTFFIYASLSGLIVLVPYLLIQIEHWSAVAAGAALLPVPVIIGIGSRLMGRVAGRYGARWPLTVGSLLVAMGLALYARIGVGEIRYWTDIFPPTLIVALGMGACVAPLTTAVMASVDTRHVGIASGFNNAVARIAGLIATAMLGFVFVLQDSGTAFVVAFRVAALIGAAACVLAAACALALIESEPSPP
jgi:EmrB/QacA subfamily drug resistance transporter